jgi:hypothetical protein
MMVKYKIVLEKDEGGGYTVHVPSLAGCHTQGDSVEDALRTLRKRSNAIWKVLKRTGSPCRRSGKSWFLILKSPHDQTALGKWR